MSSITCRGTNVTRVVLFDLTAILNRLPSLYYIVLYYFIPHLNKVF